MGTIVQTSHDDGFRSVRINRPEVRNVISIGLMAELTSAARRRFAAKKKPRP